MVMGPYGLMPVVPATMNMMNCHFQLPYQGPMAHSIVDPQYYPGYTAQLYPHARSPFPGEPSSYGMHPDTLYHVSSTHAPPPPHALSRPPSSVKRDRADTQSGAAVSPTTTSSTVIVIQSAGYNQAGASQARLHHDRTPLCQVCCPISRRHTSQSLSLSISLSVLSLLSCSPVTSMIKVTPSPRPPSAPVSPLSVLWARGSGH